MVFAERCDFIPHIFFEHTHTPHSLPLHIVYENTVELRDSSKYMFYRKNKYQHKYTQTHIEIKWTWKKLTDWSWQQNSFCSFGRAVHFCNKKMFANTSTRISWANENFWIYENLLSSKIVHAKILSCRNGIYDREREKHLLCRAKFNVVM